ncbi:MAG: DEAD/DEAH box helicase family protein [Spirochaetales bacterium]|nr:DEAD/DEAH box helicase family protein [Spirochaetales bacterium]MCF7937308.1 DEAD/DEAH box helicase family protein [Spirochaetales bacterium]
MRANVSDENGNEILWVGRLDEEGRVNGVEKAARGSTDMVPALEPHMERGDVVIHNHPSGILEPSRADLAVASRIGNQGVGFYLVNNTIEEVTVVARAHPAGAITPINPDELASLIDAGGRFPAEIEGFEPREEQVRMLRRVAEAFNQKELSVVEAGTGVGKSLAYLVPACVWAEKNDERIVISTATINLQQQLIEKDIPLVQRHLASGLQAVLVKGRGNYLCLRRLKDILLEPELFENESDQLEMLKEWAENDQDGSRSGLPVPVSDRIWSLVRSERESCLGLRCPYRDTCFFIHARRQAASARILVTNHHLLFADLSLRLGGGDFDGAAVLPAFRRVIFDEAHNIEESATSFFSRTVMPAGVEGLCNRLIHQRKRRKGGVLPRFIRKAGSSLGKEYAGVVDSVENLRTSSERALARTIDLLAGERNLLMEPALPQEKQDEILSAIGVLSNSLIETADRIASLLDACPATLEEEQEVLELRAYLRRVEEWSSVCEAWNRWYEDDQTIYWLEQVSFGEGGPQVRWSATPVDIAPLMRESLYEPVSAAVFTSATLTVASSFSFWFKRVGLDRLEGVRTLLLQSPFDYKNRVLLASPEDIPATGSPEWREYLKTVLPEMMELTEGRALVLFTSYELLNDVYQSIKTRLEPLGITVLRQGQQDRARLLRSFHDDISSVLLATSSFWEGVDAPGESLSIVVLTRLPFRVPSHPVARARYSWLEAQGKSGFRDLSLPEAVMRFRQGFGRLIRGNEDRGVVLVLDPRLSTKGYGKLFLKSVPETRSAGGNTAQVSEAIEDFLFE